MYTTRTLDEVVEALAVGTRRADVMRRFDFPTDGAFRTWVSRELQRAGHGMTLNQMVAMRRHSWRGDWDDGREDSWNQNAGANITKRANDVVTAPSYVFTRPPAMLMVYANAAALRLYKATAEQIRFRSMWALMLDPAITARIHQPETAAAQLSLAKGILQMGTWFGERQEKRALHYVDPFRRHVLRSMPLYLWEDVPADIGAIGDRFEKHLSHWQDPSLVLHFEVQAVYWRPWQLWQVSYQPLEKPTQRAFRDADVPSR